MNFDRLRSVSPLTVQSIALSGLSRAWRLRRRFAAVRTGGTFIILAATLLLGAAARPAAAEPAAAPLAAIHAPIFVGSQRLFEVGELPGEPAAQRAAEINRRIDSFVRHPSRIVPVEVKLRGPERVLTLAGRDILTVTPQDAADNLSDVPEMAQSWSRELDEALGTVRAEHQTLWSQISLSIVQSTQNLIAQAASLIPRLASTLLVLLATMFAARGARTGVRRVLRHASIDSNTLQLVRTLTYYGVWLLGWVVALGALGINPATLVAGLGVTTIALGFALKDLLSNFVSGFLILATRPFHLGDQIAVKEFEGTVERIEVRATHLRTADNRLVIIPNADLFTATIVNNTALPYRRNDLTIGVGYDADLDQVRLLARQVLAETAGVLAEPTPDVLIADLTTDGLNLRLRYHTDSHQGSAPTVGSAVRERIMVAFDKAGIPLYPTSPQLMQMIGADGARPAAQPPGPAGAAVESEPPSKEPEAEDADARRSGR